MVPTCGVHVDGRDPLAARNQLLHQHLLQQVVHAHVRLWGNRQAGPGVSEEEEEMEEAMWQWWFPTCVATKKKGLVGWKLSTCTCSSTTSSSRQGAV